MERAQGAEVNKLVWVWVPSARSFLRVDVPEENITSNAVVFNDGVGLPEAYSIWGHTKEEAVSSLTAFAARQLEQAEYHASKIDRLKNDIYQILECARAPTFIEREDDEA